MKLSWLANCLKPQEGAFSVITILRVDLSLKLYQGRLQRDPGHGQPKLSQHAPLWESEDGAVGAHIQTISVRECIKFSLVLRPIIGD